MARRRTRRAPPKNRRLYISEVWTARAENRGAVLGAASWRCGAFSEGGEARSEAELPSVHVDWRFSSNARPRQGGRIERWLRRSIAFREISGRIRIISSPLPGPSSGSAVAHERSVPSSNQLRFFHNAMRLQEEEVSDEGPDCCARRIAVQIGFDDLALPGEAVPPVSLRRGTASAKASGEEKFTDLRHLLARARSRRTSEATHTWIRTSRNRLLSHRNDENAV